MRILLLTGAGCPLVAGWEAAAPASAEIGFLDLVDDVLGGHLKESLLQGREAVDGNVALDGIGVDAAGIFQDQTGLLAVEGDVLLAGIDLAVLLVGQALDQLTADDGLVHDLFAVLELDLGVEPALGHEADQGTHLAEAVTSALFEADSLLVVVFLHEVDVYGKTALLHQLLEPVIDLQGSAGDTSGSAADKDAAFFQ